MFFFNHDNFLKIIMVFQGAQNCQNRKGHLLFDQGNCIWIVQTNQFKPGTRTFRPLVDLTASLCISKPLILGPFLRSIVVSNEKVTAEGVN
jgi:hypothetical protein